MLLARSQLSSESNCHHVQHLSAGWTLGLQSPTLLLLCQLIATSDRSSLEKGGFLCTLCCDFGIYI